MSTLAIRALDAQVRLTVPDHLAADLVVAFADIADDHPLNDRELQEIVWSATDDGGWLVRGPTRERSVPDVAAALSESLHEIDRLAARSVAADHTVLHAGAFEVNGSGVALTGDDRSGTSTLVAAAVLAGHGYLADEVCALAEPELSSRRYHRPVGLRPGAADAVGVTVPEHPTRLYSQVYPWPVGVHGQLGTVAPVRLLAFVHRRPGPVEIVPVGPADALVRLTTLGIGGAGVDRRMFRRLDRLVRAVRCVTLRYEDPAAAVDALTSAVDGVVA